MSNFILSNSTIHQSESLIIGDNEILSKKSNLKKIFEGYFLNVKDVKNIELASINSSHDEEFGAIVSGIYVDQKEKKKPKDFYYVTLNSLKHIKIDNLISKINKDGNKNGAVKITSGKICFLATEDSGYKHVRLKNQKTSKNEWNNSFTYNVENGVYEIYSYMYEYGDGDYDSMFSVKKKV